ncbi:NAD(P)-dependent oxidoreductase [Puniceibacterium sp. IMCC21224]|uniref:NAD-dependent epimerase/dehydratase family protein n=1 Tax=Puniceibacterium sp. IMCC21224 TaxID=1618204 RepID=UPI00064D77AC|nr:NAD(P)-dependent oxidoreductase [Puniceibacterium sp. IMCC21224]KMK65049.1 nucleoside-diphosphate-sugar epimerase [Puniceibacterium sp. IMCC21224]
MAVLIYGGLGHVGSWVARKLIDQGQEVIIFDMGAARFSSLGLDYLEEVRDSITLESVDVLDSHTMIEMALKYRDKIDAIVFGVAVIAGPTFKDRPFRNVSINTMGLLNALEVARILGVPKFVNLSSGAVYGDRPGGQTEDTPFTVTDLYGATKVANEVLATQYGATYGFDVRNARLYFVYGPGKRPEIMHPLYQAMFGPLAGMSDVHSANGGDQELDWTHVEDTAAGILALLNAEGMNGEAVNISCGVAYQHRDIVDRVAKLLGKESGMTLGPGPFTPRGAPLDISKAQSKLGFAPKYANIDAGLADYKTWLDKDPR